MAQAAFSHILLELTGKEQWRDTAHRSLETQPENTTLENQFTCLEFKKGKQQEGRNPHSMVQRGIACLEVVEDWLRFYNLLWLI